MNLFAEIEESKSEIKGSSLNSDDYEKSLHGKKLLLHLEKKVQQLRAEDLKNHPKMSVVCKRYVSLSSFK